MRVLVVIGPSGSGKSTVVRELHRRGLIALTPSWTTRPRRTDELTGIPEHRFVSEEAFTALQRDGFFLEAVQMFGLPYRYGLPKPETSRDGRVPTIMVRAPLMDLVARHFPERVVYQIEDGYARVRERLHGRDLSIDEYGSRLEGYEQELLWGRAVADRTFVNSGSVTDVVEAVQAALSGDFTDRTEEPCHSEA